ncbi:HPr kinase/phosphorylase [Geminicoccus flavidas]|uniref:HPr kinase/phosphorylase n=1 Tax=Geminicoccus flavidas TaxID=2506407 RepID=UPI0013588038|nr:hypothetical protein [Geminicoccus flavidas]
MQLHGRGVLVLGPSGSGKSSLCHSLLAMGGWLVADDAVELANEGGRLIAACPASIRGQLELRRLGLVRLPCRRAAAVDLVAELTRSVTIERLPPPATTGMLGVVLPLIHIMPDDLNRAGSLVAASLFRLVREVP